MYFALRLATADVRQSRIYSARRSSLLEEFQNPTLVPALNGNAFEGRPRIRRDGQEICFQSERTGNLDLYCATIQTGTIGTPRRLEELSSPEADTSPVLSADSLALYFSTEREQPGDPDVWVATRNTVSALWEMPQAVTSVSSKGFVDQPVWISDDQCTMYLTTSRNGLSYDLWVATR
jgi:Tol biopolymer transport system component